MKTTCRHHEEAKRRLGKQGEARAFSAREILGITSLDGSTRQRRAPDTANAPAIPDPRPTPSSLPNLVNVFGVRCFDLVDMVF